MILLWNNRELLFEPVKLYFKGNYYENVFADKNNKTLYDTLKHHKYAKLYSQVEMQYSEYLPWELGKYLLKLKLNGDKFYLKFLNKYGDLRYSQFYINDEHYLNKKGLYIFANAQKIQYIGRCRDSFQKRINQGYGKIHPKNCYLDGQATNCHLNWLITENKENIKLFIHTMDEDDDIERAEEVLIKCYRPPWNLIFSNKLAEF